jgi:hypothetical protein
MVDRNFIFDKKVLEENTETANNRDKFRIRSWQAYNTITVSNCGNDSSMDYHIIKFPIGLFDTYIGKFIGNGVPGFEGWSVKYNGVDVTSSFLYTFENNLPYLTSKPHVFDKDGDIFKYSKETDNTLVLKVNYDYYEDTMTINVEWNEFYSSPRLVNVTPFVLKNIPNEKNGYTEIGPYLINEEITYNTNITETGFLEDNDSRLMGTEVPLTFELQQSLLPDYQNSQILLDAFSSIINGEFDTYNELNTKIKNIKFNYDSLADTWDGVMEDFGTAAKLILGPMNDEEEDTEFINNFKTNLDNKTISSAVVGVAKLNDTIDKYTILNLYDLLSSLKEELSQLHDEVDTHLAEDWMSSNYKDIPTAVDSVYKFINQGLPESFDYNGSSDFKRYQEESKFNLANFSDTIDTKLTETSWTNDEYGLSLSNKGKVYTEDTIASIINSNITTPLAVDKNFLKKSGATITAGLVNAGTVTNLSSTMNSRYNSVFTNQVDSLNTYIRNLFSNWINTANNNRIYGRFKPGFSISTQPTELVSDMLFTHDNNVKFTSMASLKSAFDTYNGITSSPLWTTFANRKLVSKTERTKYLYNWFDTKANNTESCKSDLVNYYNYTNITNQDSLDQIQADIIAVQKVSGSYKNWLDTLAGLESALSDYNNKSNISYTE